jgi:pimeloyl-ACP methyl ester carboxylesterase
LHIEGQTALPSLLSALRIQRPVLVGHSDGGSIALIFAGSFPELTRGVVVMAPHEFVEEQALAGIRIAHTQWTKTDWPRRLARYHRDPQRVFSDWADTWAASSFRDWSIEAFLSRIRSPVLAIQGEQDEYATMRQIDVIAEQVPGAQLLKLPQCGHSPHRDQEAAVVKAIKEFVARLQ